jgi:hypothetical protein
VEWDEVEERADIDAGPIADDLLQLVTPVVHLPPEEIRGLPVERREHLMQEGGVPRVAVGLWLGEDPCRSRLLGGDGGMVNRRVAGAAQVGDGCIFPGIVEFFRPAPAGLVEARVADLPFENQKLSPCRADGLGGQGRYDGADSLVPLAMVVRADVVDVVVFPRVPPDDLSVRVGSSRRGLGELAPVRALEHCHEPAA